MTHSSEVYEQNIINSNLDICDLYLLLYRDLYLLLHWHLYRVQISILEL